MDESARTTLRGDSTRDALLDAATQVFARKGFGSANLREISELAEVNSALIGYHFHGKEGLYLAVFARMAGQIQAVVSPARARIDEILLDPVGTCPPERRKDRYLEPLLQLLEVLLTYMVHEHPSCGELFLREQQAPTAAFNVLFENIIKPNHDRLTGLVQRIRPDEDPDTARLLAANIVSQVLVIRISRMPLTRLMGWERIGDRELAMLLNLLRRNTTLLVLGD